MNILKDTLGLDKFENSIPSLEIGDYVFASKYPFSDPYEPWVVGNIDEIGRDRLGDFIRILDVGFMTWRNVIKIDAKTGEKILDQYSKYK